jgi:hypothetical protein
MSANGISTLSTKQLRQIAKLDLAKLKRQGNKLDADGTKNFGSAQFNGTSSELRLTTQPVFGFGTGDFTIEASVNPTSLTGNVLFDFRTVASEFAIYLNLNSTGNVRLYINGAYVITTTATVPTATWSRVTLSRISGLTKVFINGTQSGVTYTDANDYGTTKPLSIGSSYTSASHFAGYMADIRIVKGSETQLLLNTDYSVSFLTDRSRNNFTLTNIGPVVSSNTGPGPDTTAGFYRARNNYDITQLPDTYNGNVSGADDNPNTGGLVVGRPWVV